MSVIDVGVWVLSTGLAVGWLYARAGAFQRDCPAHGEQAKTESTSCAGILYGVIEASFGFRYWTWRGLATTNLLFWIYIGIVVTQLDEKLRLGNSGYPTIELMLLGLMVVIPFLVHEIIHVTRCYLDAVRARNGHGEVSAHLSFVPFLPLFSMFAILLPVGLIITLVDGSTATPQAIIENWLDVLRLVTVDLAGPGAQGLILVYSAPLYAPTLFVTLYLLSWLTARAIAPTSLDLAAGDVPEINVGLVGAIHVGFIMVAVAVLCEFMVRGPV